MPLPQYVCKNTCQLHDYLQPKKSYRIIGTKARLTQDDHPFGGQIFGMTPWEMCYLEWRKEEMTQGPKPLGLCVLLHSRPVWFAASWCQKH